MIDEKKCDKAVAVLYDKAKSEAPLVIASGRGEIATRIIETARKSGIHIKEDPDLLELLAKVPIGETIPVELYQVIAEILSFVYRVNERYKNSPPQ